MGLEAILAHGFCRGLRANATGDSQIFCLSVLMEVSKRKTGDRRSNPCGSKGILLLCAQGDNYNSKVLELALNGYPLVLMDRRMQGISIPCVRTDNYEAANEVTKILIAMGHKKSVF